MPQHARGVHAACTRHACMHVQASRIAYGPDKRFRRVVTLAGQLIADSGTMSGGGRALSGKMALGSAAPRGSGDTKVSALSWMA